MGKGSGCRVLGLLGTPRQGVKHAGLYRLISR